MRILGPQGPLDCAMRDLSRTGVRIQLPAAAFEDVTRDLLTVIDRLRDVMGTCPTVYLHSEMLGPLVSRAAHTSRVILPQDHKDPIEVGCSFDRPITDEETAMLGIQLPPCKVQAQPAAKPPEPSDESAPPSAVHIRVPKPDGGESGDDEAPTGSRVRYHVRVTGRGISMECDAREMSPEAIVLLIQRDVVLRREATPNMIKVVSRLSSRLGERVRLHVSDRQSEVWSGAARISGVDVPDDATDYMHVTFSFLKPLTTAERAKARV